MAKNRLFLPDEFPGIPTQDFPEQLTFVAPPGPPLQPHMHFKEIFRAPHSTKPLAVTKTAKSVQDLKNVTRGKQHLTQVRRARELWHNLIKYSDMDPNVAHLATCTPRARPSDIPDPLPLPQAEEQAAGVHELWRWFLRHSLPDAGTVNCEPAVQDEIYKQVVDPVNSSIKTRYGNRNMITDPWPDMLDNVVPPGVFFPAWGRPCNDIRPDRLIKDRGKAGIPDLILFRESLANRNVCIAEVKSFWSYSNEDFDEILTNAAAPGGNFPWANVKKRDKAFLLVKQKWGEMVSNGSSWGWTTNGRRIIIFARTGKNQVAFCKPHSLTNRNLYRALIGLTFAAIDGRSGDNNGGGLEDNSDSQDLIQQLCGPLDWPAGIVDDAALADENGEYGEDDGAEGDETDSSDDGSEVDGEEPE